ncbi:MAG: WbqC family protein [Bacteroidetes bacterium]|nr:WbqC family protein [Bacteroidota bacterium]HNR20299.1 WbqC family protein [Bacteroidia bacterium]HNU33927.1 WbqC family protein [Bacteroidia bacterium]
MNTPVFATAYFPPVIYLQELIKHGSVFIEAHEHFQKQTYRNRCEILNANGVQTLSVPLFQTHQKVKTGLVQISFAQNWKLNHWRSIESAYNRSAYFEFYKDELKDLFFEKEKYLLVFNTKILLWVLKQLKVKNNINFTEDYLKSIEDGSDCKYLSSAEKATAWNCKKYPQVFSYKTDFIPGLSCIDLLFNCGPDSIYYLQDRIG